MQGWDLIAITEAGKDKIKEYNVPDDRVIIAITREEPFTLSFLIKHRFRKQFLGSTIEEFINKTFSEVGLIEERDYQIKIKQSSSKA